MEKTSTGIFNTRTGGVTSRVIEGIVERLLNGKKRELQNSWVSKQGSHDSIATFSHNILQSV
jgi:uncharacterized protein YidB (DUF937 family)